jgi:hypothetical protein
MMPRATAASNGDAPEGGPGGPGARGWRWLGWAAQGVCQAKSYEEEDTCHMRRRIHILIHLYADARRGCPAVSWAP